MTGEVTLTGRVLLIGGVKEKLLGAHRAGIKTVMLPKANEADLEDLPREVLEQLEIRPVGTIDEALSVALRGASFNEGKLRFPTRRPPSAGRSPEAGVRMHGEATQTQTPRSTLEGVCVLEHRRADKRPGWELHNRPAGRSHDAPVRPEDALICSNRRHR